jgi:acetyl-CoA/propionyl-CoA carboxylase biotin carboxyl carrier protein
MRQELIATVGDREIPVAVESEPGGVVRVEVGQRVLRADARRVRSGTWSVIADGRSYLVDLDPRAGSLEVSVGLAEFAVDIADARRRKLARAVAGGARAAARGEIIEAPIAGRVVAIAVAVGDVVEPDQAVCVLEAMKMENEIKAERGGTVASIHVEPGQSVDTHDRLITLT